MALQKPFPLQHATVSYGAEPVFRFIGDLFSEGVVGINDMAVSQKAAGANMSVDVAIGDAYLTFDTPFGGARRVRNDTVSNSGTPGSPSADWATTFTTAHATLPRIDRVVLLARDSNLDGGGAYDAVFKVIPGTATSGATLANLTGAAAVPVNSILLANVLCSAADSSIINADIDTTVRDLAAIGAGSISPWINLTAVAALKIPASVKLVVLGVGSTAITSISNTYKGHVIVLLSNGYTGTITDGTNLKLAGNYTMSADDTMTLVHDGNTWYECARSTN